MPNLTVEWRIYYADGSTYDSDQGAPQDAPGLGVGVIVQRDPEVGRRLVARLSYYFMTSDGWWTGAEDVAGLLTYLMTPGWKFVKLGQMMSNTTYYKLIDCAQTDLDFPKKSAWLSGEKV